MNRWQFCGRCEGGVFFFVHYGFPRLICVRVLSSMSSRDGFGAAGHMVWLMHGLQREREEGDAGFGVSSGF